MILRYEMRNNNSEDGLRKVTEEEMYNLLEKEGTIKQKVNNEFCTMRWITKINSEDGLRKVTEEEIKKLAEKEELKAVK